jgi:hypothetical protein
VKYQGDKPAANSLVTDDKGNTIGHVVSSSAEHETLALVSLKLSDIEQTLYLNSQPLTIVKSLANND